MNGNLENIQLRALNEITYCKRLFYLMYVMELFDENADTIQGKYHHDKREKTSKNNMLDGSKIFSLVLSDASGILNGKLDGIVAEENEYIPIEDKNSKQPKETIISELFGVKVESDVWINDLPQLIGQMYLLRENGYACEKGKIYYRGSNNVVEIEYKENYNQLIFNAINACKETAMNNIPEPLLESEKCIRCSMNWVCLPDEINFNKKKSLEPRRLYPGRPDGSVLYLTSPGSKMGKSGECFTIVGPCEEKNIIPIKDVDDICIFGHSQITTQAMFEIIKKGGTISYMTSGGNLYATTISPLSKNILLRIAQYEKFRDESEKLKIAKKTIIAKIMNQRTFLRRNRRTSIDIQLKKLKKLIIEVDKCNSVSSLLGIEGNASMIYWNTFPYLFAEKKWKFCTRNRRPPKDPVNAMLSFCYSLLVRDCISAVVSTGFDYLLGYYHSVVPGRPALALDIMEPYRVLISDSIVLRMINEKTVSSKDFAIVGNGVYMKPELKRKIIRAYEVRIDQMVTHPYFGYKLSYRRMLALDVKMLAKYIQGEIDSFEPMTTR